MKPVQRGAQAQADIKAALANHQSEARHIARNFVDALEKAVAPSQRAPGTGSPRYGCLANFAMLFFTWSRKIICW